MFAGGELCRGLAEKMLRLAEAGFLIDAGIAIAAVDVVDVLARSEPDRCYRSGHDRRGLPRSIQP